MAVADDDLRRRHAARFEIAQEPRPGVDRLAVAGLERNDPFRAIRERRERDQHGRLLLLEAGLHVDPVDPEVDDLEPRQALPRPRVKLDVPLLFEPRDRRGRDGRFVTQEASERQVHVPLGQAVEVELRQETVNLTGASHEERKQPALEALVQVARPGAVYGDGAALHREPPGLAVAVAVAA